MRTQEWTLRGDTGEAQHVARAQGEQLTFPSQSSLPWRLKNVPWGPCMYLAWNMQIKGNALDGDVCTHPACTKPWTSSTSLGKSSEVAHAYHPRTHKMGTGRWEVQGHHWCHSELRASLGYVKHEGETFRDIIGATEQTKRENWEKTMRNNIWES